MKIFTNIIIISLLSLNTGLMAQSYLPIRLPDGQPLNRQQLKNTVPHKESFTHKNSQNRSASNERTEGAPTPLYDSIYYWAWDTLSYAWVNHPYARNIDFTYNANNSETGYIYQNWDTVALAWVNAEKYIAGYDANNNDTNDIYQGWDTASSQWVNIFQNFNGYDSNRNDTSYLYQIWNNGAWQNLSYFSFSYDVHSNELSRTEQTWSGTAWVNLSQDLFTYDVNNNNTSHIVQTWSGTAWVNATQNLLIYNTGNNVINNLLQNWNDSVWLNSSRDTFSFTIQNRETSDIYQTWNGTAWLNSSKDTLAYNAQNNDTCSIYKTWDSTTVSWVNQSREFLTYDANNDNNGDLYQTWDTTMTWMTTEYDTYLFDFNNIEEAYTNQYFTNDLINNGSDSAHYYYHLAETGINKMTAQTGYITIYPDPAVTEITITSSPVNNETVTVSILNMLGEEATLPTTIQRNGESAEIDISKLVAGMYFLEMKSERGVSVQKFIKE